MIIAIGNSVGVGGGGFTPSAEYQAVLDRATVLTYTLPTIPEQIIHDQLITDLKAGGEWDDLDVFYPMVTNIDFATLNWKAPSSFQLTLVNSPTYSTTLGFTGNGSTQYIDTGWGTLDGVNFTDTDAGVGVYVSTDVDENSRIYGAYSGANVNSTVLRVRSVNILLTRIIGVEEGTGANTNSIGFYQTVRTSPSSINIFKNGTAIGPYAKASQNRTSITLYILAADVSGTSTLHATQGVKEFHTGSALVGLESSMYTILNNFYNP